MTTSRNRIVHDYFGIDYSIVRQIKEVYLPLLIKNLNHLSSRQRVGGWNPSTPTKRRKSVKTIKANKRQEVCLSVINRLLCFH
ncbi:MAG: DUF86 domain-containing protein [Tannerellaceae bacterium]|nr:DUF86 domain-containing protein [Tannerellaceae bacterium]